MGTFAQVLDIAPTRSDLPRLQIHPDISPGTLILFDPTHPVGAFSGVPEDGGALPNVVREQAAAIFERVDLADMDLLINRQRESSATFLWERTSKGGLHGLPSQSAQTTNNNNLVLRPGAAIRNDIHGLIPTASSDPGPGFYVSVWYKITRVGVSGLTSYSRSHFATNTSNFGWHTQSTASPSAANMIDTFGPSDHANGNATLLAWGPGRNWTGTKPSSTIAALLGMGQFDAWQAFSNNRNKLHGVIVYRAIIEYLALTDRSDGSPEGEWAAALAADRAAFTKAFAEGGKFYGDSWTDPATFA